MEEKKEESKSQSVNTSESIKCHSAILQSENPERVSDFIKLCRIHDIPEQSQEQFLLLHDLKNYGKQKLRDMKRPEPGETMSCEEAKEKYNLEAVCHACTRHDSSNKTDLQQDRELFLYLLNSKPDKNFFPIKEEYKRIIEASFTSSENVQNGDSSMYVSIYRTYYKALAYLFYDRAKNWNEKLKKQFDSSLLYNTWKILNATYCTNLDNRAVKCKIDYLYGATFNDSPEKKQYRDSIIKKIKEYKKNSQQLQRATEDFTKEAKKSKSVTKKAQPQPVLNMDFFKVGKKIPVIPTLEDNLLIAKGYDMVTDRETLEWMSFEAAQTENGICLDIIHMKDYEGIFILLQLGDKKLVLTEPQLGNLSEYIGFKAGKITTSSIIALYSTLYKNGYKHNGIKANIIQPSEAEYCKNLAAGEQNPATSSQDINAKEKDILTLYARSFRPGTGDEDCIVYVNDSPVINRARQLGSEELPFTVKINSVLKEGQWDTIKKEIHSTLERNEIFRIHNAGIWKQDDNEHKFAYFVANNKARGMETIVRSTVFRILEMFVEYPDFGIYPGKDI